MTTINFYANINNSCTSRTHVSLLPVAKSNSGNSSSDSSVSEAGILPFD